MCSTSATADHDVVVHRGWIGCCVAHNACGSVKGSVNGEIEALRVREQRGWHSNGDDPVGSLAAPGWRRLKYAGRPIEIAQARVGECPKIVLHGEPRRNDCPGRAQLFRPKGVKPLVAVPGRVSVTANVRSCRG